VITYSYSLYSTHWRLNKYLKPGMDPAWSAWGGGCSAHSGALLQSLAWLLNCNCNCCAQFAYHDVINQITVSHFVSG
jgi:hypothetical protein